MCDIQLSARPGSWISHTMACWKLYWWADTGSASRGYATHVSPAKLLDVWLHAINIKYQIKAWFHAVLMSRSD